MMLIGLGNKLQSLTGLVGSIEEVCLSLGILLVNQIPPEAADTIALQGVNGGEGGLKRLKRRVGLLHAIECRGIQESDGEAEARLYPDTSKNDEQESQPCRLTLGNQLFRSSQDRMEPVTKNTTNHRALKTAFAERASCLGLLPLRVTVTYKKSSLSSSRRSSMERA
ncbi:unnamed protein product [Caretta caretta]